jgi:hypothetical protein
MAAQNASFFFSKNLTMSCVQGRPRTWACYDPLLRLRAHLMALADEREVVARVNLVLGKFN